VFFVVGCGSLVVSPESDILREVDIEPVDWVQTEGNVAVHPDFADGHGHRIGLNRLDELFDAVEGGVSIDAISHWTGSVLRGQTGFDQSIHRLPV